MDELDSYIVVLSTIELDSYIAVLSTVEEIVTSTIEYETTNDINDTDIVDDAEALLGDLVVIYSSTKIRDRIIVDLGANTYIVNLEQWVG